MIDEEEGPSTLDHVHKKAVRPPQRSVLSRFTAQTCPLSIPAVVLISIWLCLFSRSCVCVNVYDTYFFFYGFRVLLIFLVSKRTTEILGKERRERIRRWRRVCCCGRSTCSHSALNIYIYETANHSINQSLCSYFFLTALSLSISLSFFLLSQQRNVKKKTVSTLWIPLQYRAWGHDLRVLENQFETGESFTIFDLYSKHLWVKNV